MLRIECCMGHDQTIPLLSKPAAPYTSSGARSQVLA